MDARSGGKIVTKRRKRFTTTPYDRPPAAPPPPPENRNWLTGVIFPATLTLASGAAKILSSVFDSHSSSSSSSSSFSSSDGEQATAEDNVTYEDNSGNAEDADFLFEDHGTPPDVMQCISKEQKKSGGKDILERLLMQERFSREERDKFVYIINSRVVDFGRGEEQDVAATGTPDETTDKSIDLCSRAVWEARKWLEEKKVGSSPLSDVADRSPGLNSTAVTHIDTEVGSPVDVAKSYMRSRPPWASVSAEHVELQTPTLASQLFKQGTLFSAGYDSVSKKRPSFESGSWNIQDEIRRVRKKATEDMLHSLPSAKVDLSSFALLSTPGQDRSVAKLMNSRGDEGRKLICVSEIRPVEAFMTAANGSTTDGISALETMGDGIVNDAIMSSPAILVPEQFQYSQTIKADGESTAASVSCHSASPRLDIKHCTDPQSTMLNGSQVEEMREADVTHNTAGIPTSQASLASAEVDTEEIHKKLVEASLDAVTSGIKTTDIIPVEHTCDLISEASVEVPIVQETDSVAGLHQSSSGVHHDELSWLLPNSNNLAREADCISTKQDLKKPGRYNRRAKGRGK